MHKLIEFNQEACSKEYIDMNAELKKQTKNHFEKDFFKLIWKEVQRYHVSNNN